MAKKHWPAPTWSSRNVRWNRDCVDNSFLATARLSCCIVHIVENANLTRPNAEDGRTFKIRRDSLLQRETVMWSMSTDVRTTQRVGLTAKVIPVSVWTAHEEYLLRRLGKLLTRTYTAQCYRTALMHCVFDPSVPCRLIWCSIGTQDELLNHYCPQGPSCLQACSYRGYYWNT